MKNQSSPSMKKLTQMIKTQLGPQWNVVLTKPNLIKITAPFTNIDGKNFQMKIHPYNQADNLNNQDEQVETYIITNQGQTYQNIKERGTSQNSYADRAFINNLYTQYQIGFEPYTMDGLGQAINDRLKKPYLYLETSVNHPTEIMKLIFNMLHVEIEIDTYQKLKQFQHLEQIMNY